MSEHEINRELDLAMAELDAEVREQDQTMMSYNRLADENAALREQAKQMWEAITPLVNDQAITVISKVGSDEPPSNAVGAAQAAVWNVMQQRDRYAAANVAAGTENDALRERVVELERFVEYTADGKPVGFASVVYMRLSHPRWTRVGYEIMACNVVGSSDGLIAEGSGVPYRNMPGQLEYVWGEIGDCYSTREAALAASKRAGGEGE